METVFTPPNMCTQIRFCYIVLFVHLRLRAMIISGKDGGYTAIIVVEGGIELTVGGKGCGLPPLAHVEGDCRTLKIV